MLRGLRRLRPSPALVVASTALLVSLGGVGYAATKLPRNSVGTAQLRNNAVSSAKVKNHSLKSVDLARGTVVKGPAGPSGATGPQGATGPRGPAGVGIGGSCSGGAAISGVASDGSVSCQPPASDSADGYLTAAEHAAFGAARTFTYSSSGISNQSFPLAHELAYTSPKITIPSNLHKLFVLWEGEWEGGTSTAPSTMDCAVAVDDKTFASPFPAASSRRSTSTGGWVDFTVSASFDVTPGQHEVEAGCGNDTGGASIGSGHLTVIATE